MAKAREYFPLGKAHNEAFCNRKEELKHLVENVGVAKHTLLMAPRRYGKSSLAENAIHQSQLPYVNIDFHLAASEEGVEQLITRAVSQLISKSFGAINKLAQAMKAYLKTFQPKLVIGSERLYLELVRAPDSLPATNVVEVLLLAEKLLAEKKKRAILFLDEFQVVGLIAKGSGVEAAIRNAAQSMRHLAIIFSGSNRTLLANMFEDKARPLYKLCRKIIVTRIAEEHYYRHLNHIAKLTWKKELSEKVFNQIMHLTQRHPYYLNYLCDELWLRCEKLPLLQDVNASWQRVLEEERSDLLKEFLELSDGQRKLMIYIANKNKTDTLTSQETLAAVKMPASTVSKSVNILLERDMLEKQGGTYVILNPALCSLLQAKDSL